MFKNQSYVLEFKGLTLNEVRQNSFLYTFSSDEEIEEEPKDKLSTTNLSQSLIFENVKQWNKSTLKAFQYGINCWNCHVPFTPNINKCAALSSPYFLPLAINGSNMTTTGYFCSYLCAYQYTSLREIGKTNDIRVYDSGMKNNLKYLYYQFLLHNKCDKAKKSLICTVPLLDFIPIYNLKEYGGKMERCDVRNIIIKKNIEFEESLLI